MKKLILAVLVLGLMVSPQICGAGDYTITLTTEQEQAIVWATNQYNVGKIIYDKEGNIVADNRLTAKQYFMLRVNDFVDDYNAQKAKIESNTLRDAYSNANEATKTQIKTLLGVQ